jgi:hypothetical protein
LGGKERKEEEEVEEGREEGRKEQHLKVSIRKKGVVNTKSCKCNNNKHHGDNSDYQ